MKNPGIGWPNSLRLADCRRSTAFAGFLRFSSIVARRFAAEVIADGLAAVVANAFTEMLAFFGGHAAESAAPAAIESEASGAMPAETAEEDPAKREQAEGLPEGEFVPAEQGRHEPVPEVEDDFAADEGEEDHSQDCQWNDEKQFD
jgi:hypothetical protein